LRFLIKNIYLQNGTMLLLGFISIRRYRDIDRGIGDRVIIVVPRDCRISYTNTHLTRALLNSLHRIHRAIIIARTVTGWMPISCQSATGCHHVTGPSNTRYTMLHCLICTLPTHIIPVQADDDKSSCGGSFVGGQHHMSFPRPRGVQIVKF